jgi:hypothetical protein
MIRDELQIFKDWWLKERPFTIPHSNSIVNVSSMHGVVLYRAECWQVQLFVIEPNSAVPDHRHPNVDSYDVYLSGDIEFTLEGVNRHYNNVDISEAFFNGSNIYYGTSVRILPNAWHGGNSHGGGSFLSIQQWLNGVVPTSIGDDWMPKTSDARRIYSENS